MCFMITNLIFYLCGGRVRERKEMIYSLGLLVLLCCIDGLLAMNHDMIMDPVAVDPAVKGWVWIGGGEYFGIPISNFIGWFLVTFIAMLIIRGYMLISKKEFIGSKSIYTCAFAVIMYTLYLLMNAAQSIQLGHPEYVLIGFAAMAPFIIIGLLAYYLNLKNLSSKRTL